jgi:SdrD B-like protein
MTPFTVGCLEIGDRVWLDEDCDGIQDKSDVGFTEPGVADVVVRLFTCDGDFVAETTTNASGAYSFTGVDEYLVYKVCFELPDGYVFAPANQGGSEGLDSDVNLDGCTDCFDPSDCKPIRYIDAGLCVIEESEGCRMTGGGVNELGEWNGTLTNGKATNGDRYTFGGQAGANTALPPQPAGEWEHNNHSGPSGAFAFHGGTHSAPDGTEISLIECYDEGFCNPARPAPDKQLDFYGVGMFKNLRGVPPIISSNVVAGQSLHYFEVNVDDGGEPGRGKTVPNSCPGDGFGRNGSVALVDCACPDYYRIIIHATTDPTSAVIYTVAGYPAGGNLQIHPLTGFDK